MQYKSSFIILIILTPERQLFFTNTVRKEAPVHRCTVTSHVYYPIRFQALVGCCPIASAAVPARGVMQLCVRYSYCDAACTHTHTHTHSGIPDFHSTRRADICPDLMTHSAMTRICFYINTDAALFVVDTHTHTHTQYQV